VKALPATQGFGRQAFPFAGFRWAPWGLETEQGKLTQELRGVLQKPGETFLSPSCSSLHPASLHVSTDKMYKRDFGAKALFQNNSS